MRSKGGPKRQFLRFKTTPLDTWCILFFVCYCLIGVSSGSNGSSGSSPGMMEPATRQNNKRHAQQFDGSRKQPPPSYGRFPAKVKLPKAQPYRQNENTPEPTSIGHILVKTAWLDLGRLTSRKTSTLGDCSSRLSNCSPCLLSQEASQVPSCREGSRCDRYYQRISRCHRQQQTNKRLHQFLRLLWHR